LAVLVIEFCGFIEGSINDLSWITYYKITVFTVL